MRADERAITELRSYSLNSGRHAESPHACAATARCFARQRLFESTSRVQIMLNFFKKYNCKLILYLLIILPGYLTSASATLTIVIGR